jgi:hypothetical protein
MKNCTNCSSFHQGLRNEKAEKNRVNTKVVGECDNPQVKNKYCMSDYMQCGGKHHESNVPNIV